MPFDPKSFLRLGFNFGLRLRGYPFHTYQKVPYFKILTDQLGLTHFDMAPATSLICAFPHRVHVKVTLEVL